MTTSMSMRIRGQLQQGNIKRAGWLLACDAPSNRTRGNEVMTSLSVSEQRKARAHRDYLTKLYAKNKEWPRRMIELFHGDW